MRSTYGLPEATGGRIIDRVGCPLCGSERWYPCTPLRETGHATCLRPHKARAILADGGTPARPSGWTVEKWAEAIRAAVMSR